MRTNQAASPQFSASLALLLAVPVVLSLGGCAFATNGKGPVFGITYWALENLDVIKSAADESSDSAATVPDLAAVFASPPQGQGHGYYPQPYYAQARRQDAYPATGHRDGDRFVQTMKVLGIPPILAITFALDLGLLPATVPCGLTGWWE